MRFFFQTALSVANHKNNLLGLLSYPVRFFKKYYMYSECLDCCVLFMMHLYNWVIFAAGGAFARRCGSWHPAYHEHRVGPGRIRGRHRKRVEWSTVQGYQHPTKSIIVLTVYNVLNVLFTRLYNVIFN
jgi:hypothetical protein